MDLTTGEWLAGEALWELVQRFLIIHRTHEVRLLPELLVGEVDPDGAFEYIEDAETLLGPPVRPLPDDEEDASRVPRDLVGRLAARARSLRDARENR